MKKIMLFIGLCFLLSGCDTAFLSYIPQQQPVYYSQPAYVTQPVYDPPPAYVEPKSYMVYPTIPGTRSRDYSKPGYRVEEEP